MKKPKLYVNIGGAKGLDKIKSPLDWKVLDVSGKASAYNVDLNAQTKFPIENDVVTAYYSSMTLEHIYPENLLFVLKEVYRTLDKGGLFRIVVPDFTIGMKWFLNSPEKLDIKSNPTAPDYYPNTKMGKLMAWAISEMPAGKPGKRTGHRQMFDYETMVWWLVKAGFQRDKIHSMKYGKHSDVFTGMDFDRYREWSLYVEVSK